MRSFFLRRKVKKAILGMLTMMNISEGEVQKQLLEALEMFLPKNRGFLKSSASPETDLSDSQCDKIAGALTMGFFWAAVSQETSCLRKRLKLSDELWEDVMLFVHRSGEMPKVFPFEYLERLGGEFQDSLPADLRTGSLTQALQTAIEEPAIPYPGCSQTDFVVAA